MAVSSAMELWPLGGVGRLETEGDVNVGRTGVYVTGKKRYFGVVLCGMASTPWTMSCWWKHCKNFQARADDRLLGGMT